MMEPLHQYYKSMTQMLKMLAVYNTNTNKFITHSDIEESNDGKTPGFRIYILSSLYCACHHQEIDFSYRVSNTFMLLSFTEKSYAYRTVRPKPRVKR